MCGRCVSRLDVRIGPGMQGTVRQQAKKSSSAQDADHQYSVTSLRASGLHTYGVEPGRFSIKGGALTSHILGALGAAKSTFRSGVAEVRQHFAGVGPLACSPWTPMVILWTGSSQVANARWVRYSFITGCRASRLYLHAVARGTMRQCAFWAAAVCVTLAWSSVRRCSCPLICMRGDPSPVGLPSSRMFMRSSLFVAGQRLTTV